MSHAYPKELAEFVTSRWNEEQASTAEYFSEWQDEFQLPDLLELESILSTCYQASLMNEEHRQVTCRIILGPASCYPADEGPPHGLHRLEFTEPRKFSAHELRRLSPAASFHRSLLGLRRSPEGKFKIWGFVHSGPRWLRAIHGGRGTAPAMPPTVVINISGPGHLEVCKGAVTIGQLSDGRIFGPSMNVFASNWLPEAFENARAEHLLAHEQNRARANTVWADLDPDISRVIGQQMFKRVITAIRTFSHGGTLIMVPQALAPKLLERNPHISLKYKFTDGEPRARFRTLMLNIMDGLAEVGGRGFADGAAPRVNWSDYEGSKDAKLADLDEAVFEVSHLIAGLSTVDGAVLMTKRFELLGFGGEIFCENSEVSEIARALDLEGTQVRLESVEGVGTRHRSAFRFCNELKSALAVVVSQDGSVHFVRWRNDRIMYWDHQATTSSFDF